MPEDLPVQPPTKPVKSNSCCMVVTLGVVLGVVMFLMLPQFLNRPGKHPDAEVKQNCHAIQLALERYAVDHDGLYPPRLMGGDWTDTQVVWESWVLMQCPSGDPEQMLSRITNPEKHDNWEPAAPDMGDPLVMESYMPSFPGNPFVKNNARNRLKRIHHFPGSAYPGHAPWWRYVGGRENNRMCEVFGPTFTGPPGMCSNAGDIYVHHIFNKPAYDYEGDEWKTPKRGWVDPSGNEFLAGNFSYFPRLEAGMSFYMNLEPVVTGYTMAGYGSIRTHGQDVYNRNGNYKGRYRTESCLQEARHGHGGNIPYPTDIPCLLDSGKAPSPDCNNGGSDTIVDGVIVTLDSGVDKKSAKTHFEPTDGS